MNNRYSVVVSSCDNYSDLWMPFFSLIKKYWPAFDYPVYICTESKTFSYEGFDIHCPLNVPQTNTWSQNLIDLLNHIDSEYIIFMLDDFWLKSPVNVNLLSHCMEIFENDKNMGFLCLIQQKASSLMDSKQDFRDVVQVPKSQFFRITTQAGIWRKSYLRQILRKHETAWQFEWFGSKRSKRLALQPYVVSEKVGSVFDYDSGGVLFRGAYVEEYIGNFLNKEGIVLSKKRPIAPKVQLENKEYSKRRNLFSPRYIYDYIRSMI